MQHRFFALISRMRYIGRWDFILVVIGIAVVYLYQFIDKVFAAFFIRIAY